jgi:hypothetical protein
LSVPKNASKAIRVSAKINDDDTVYKGLQDPTYRGNPNSVRVNWTNGDPWTESRSWLIVDKKNLGGEAAWVKWQARGEVFDSMSSFCVPKTLGIGRRKAQLPLICSANRAHLLEDLFALLLHCRAHAVEHGGFHRCEANELKCAASERRFECRAVDEPKLLANWRSFVLRIWAQRDIDMLAFNHALRAIPHLPEAAPCRGGAVPSLPYRALQRRARFGE